MKISVYCLSGYVYHSLEQYNKVEVNCNKAIALSRDYASTYCVRDCLYLISGDLVMCKTTLVLH